MNTKEEILKLHSPYGHKWSKFILPDQMGFLYEAMQEYSDQQNAELLEKIEQLEGEQQVLVERISQLTPFKKEGI